MESIFKQTLNNIHHTQGKDHNKVQKDVSFLC